MAGRTDRTLDRSAAQAVAGYVGGQAVLTAAQKVEQAASGMADAARRASGPLTLGA